MEKKNAWKKYKEEDLKKENPQMKLSNVPKKKDTKI